MGFVGNSIYGGVLCVAAILYIFKNTIFPNKKKYAIDVKSSNPDPQGETVPKRSSFSPDKLVAVSNENVHTLYDALVYSSKRVPNNHCLGTRPLKEIHVQEKEVTNADGSVEKKKWTYLELGPYEWVSYAQMRRLAQQVGSALVSSEKEGGVALKAGQSKVGLYAETSAQWLLTAHGCFAQSMTVVTVYANLGEEGLTHAVNDTKLTHLLTDPNLLPTLLKILPTVPQLKCLILTTTREKPNEKVVKQLEDKKIRIVFFDDLVKVGEKSQVEDRPPKPSDLAVIMYTSGTTGVPKGVMMTHSTLVASLSGAEVAIGTPFNINENDVYLAFLPLAHVLELIVEHVLILRGSSLAYASPRTLTDALVKNCRGDITEARPTLMAGVPVIWERIRKGALEKVNHSNLIVRTLFYSAYYYKKWLLEHGFTWTPIVDRVVFSKFRAQVGGRLRGLVSGGAPISPNSHQFLRICFSVPALQGYGLTETSGLIAALPIEHLAVERVGTPLPCTEVKLVDVPEMGYTSHDQPHPRGEIWVRGPNISLGYYNMEEKTKEDFKEGGWFATGDVGEWWPDGTLSVIDRKKNLVKLSHGEYVALERLESKFKSSEFIEDICIIADSQKDLPDAIVLPNRKNLEKWASQNGVSDSDWHKLCENEKATKAVLSSINSIATKEGMKSFEKVGTVWLCPDEWTVDNGLLTSAMKLKRNEIVKKYKKQVESMGHKKK